VDDEHGLAARGGDALSGPEHLHEVRAADKSPGVPQERHQHRPSAQPT
jgi:hypothetical protein